MALQHKKCVHGCERKRFVDCCNIWSLANETLGVEGDGKGCVSLVFVINNDLPPCLSLLVACSHLSLPESFKSD